MPFADNDGVKIHYQVEGEGTPILLLTGFPGSIKDWYKHGYVDSLKQKYQLILIDKRGHGESDKPHNPEDYLQEKYASDIIAVMDDLHIEKAHFWGFSFGAYIGMILARTNPERFHAFIFGGGSPQDLGEELIRKKFKDFFKGGAEGFISMFKKFGIEFTSEQKKQIESWDFDALKAATTAEDLLQNLEPQLLALDVPVLFYAGEKDEWGHYERQLEFCKRMKNAKVIGFPDHGHSVDNEKDLVLPHVLEFLERF